MCGDWLHAAMDAARGDATGSWLSAATGAMVRVQSRADGISPAEKRGILMGPAKTSAAEGTMDGASSTLWRVRILDESSTICTVPSSSLKRMVPLAGSLARCVIGESCGLVGKVLSAQGGVAVVKIADDHVGISGKLVRVLPLDALCRLGESP